MKWFQHFVLAFLSFGIVILNSGFLPFVAQQLQTLEFNLPTRLMSSESATASPVLLPDWQRISFGTMPPIQQSGAVNIDGASRTWKAGQTPDQYMRLGDIQEALRPDLLSLNNIVKNSDFKPIPIDSFPLLGQQTLKHLVDVVPSLGQLSANQAPPIAALLSQKGAIADSTIPLSTLLSQNPAVVNLKLNEIDLSSFTLADIPGIESVQLGQLQGWQDTLIADVPGLNALPLADFPVPLTELGNAVARIDFIWGKAEKQRTRTISGSDVAGFSVPCQGQECPYIELDDLENSGRNIRGEFEGHSWISGKYQQVEGGWGCLKFVNGGKEPTGRLPFGSAFKVVVMEPDEKTDTVDTALFFRFKNGCGATPYFIGPVPFLTYRVNTPIFLGSLDNESQRAVSVPQTSSISGALPGTQNSKAPLQNNSPLEAPCPTAVSFPADVNIEALKAAITGIESDGRTDVIGPYVCADKGQNCGRALGKYQDMSYNPYAVQAIVSKPGGAEWLNQVNSGGKVTKDELFQFYPPADQESAFEVSLQDKIASTSQQIDPRTGQMFAGERLIERIAQKHFGGDHSQVDGGATDAFGRLTLKTYGQDALRRYKENSNVCG